MKNKWWIILLVISLFVFAGCTGNQTYEPKEINAEVDVCDVCNMSVAHERYATQLILTDGEIYTFDDIGCMMEMVDRGVAVQKEDIAKLYVRDVKTADWVELADAYYVYDEEIWTPMAYGVISFASKGNAETYVKDRGGGEIWDDEQMKAHHWGWEK